MYACLQKQDLTSQMIFAYLKNQLSRESPELFAHELYIHIM